MATSSRTDPLLSVSASNEARISDLCDVTAIFEKELTQEPATEQERSKGAVPEYQKQWHEQEKLMRTECESLLLFVNGMCCVRKNYYISVGLPIATFYARERIGRGIGRGSKRMAAESEVERHKDREPISERADHDVEVSTNYGRKMSNYRLRYHRRLLNWNASIYSSKARGRRGIKTSKLDKWQRLEGKGETELEPLRKQKLEQAAEAKTYLTCIGFHGGRTYGFGFGRRACPGSHMGRSMLQITAASILCFFDILPALDTQGNPIDIVPEFAPESITSHPLPFKCKISPRKGKDVEILLDEYMNVEYV
ncbi:hypothetical protein Agabi119p4_6091 [Agaricus bisporus var. burnettii]|uniref:Cytochrome P450 n=1 Tax=Agaricus bisporus var. burnettii TaxID=192524 RepID=A0A8H7KG54_AGABI|nr:hypothetical protein Agabi119p4_6091 [Agaricus bisporus var. burnettii]